MTSIAAILTIVGYSLNDTVVVFDRIREMLRKYKKMPTAELLDIVDQLDAVAHRDDLCHHDAGAARAGALRRPGDRELLLRR